MVERLCAAYGTPLHAVTAADNETAGAQYGLQDAVANGTVGQAQQQQQQPSASVHVYIKAEHITQEAGTYAALSSVAKAAASMPRGCLSDTSLGSGGPAKKEEAELNAEFCTGVTDATLVPSSSGHLHSSPPMRPASKQGLKRAASAPASSPVKVEAAAKSSSPSTYYAFPTVEQLQRATDQELRDAGFGYRAKFVTGSVALLSDKPGGGGQAWLLGLRQLPFEQAVEELSALPGEYCTLSRWLACSLTVKRWPHALALTLHMPGPVGEECSATLVWSHPDAGLCVLALSAVSLSCASKGAARSELHVPMVCCLQT